LGEFGQTPVDRELYCRPKKGTRDPSEEHREWHEKLSRLSGLHQEQVHPLLSIARTEPPLVTISDGYVEKVKAGEIILLDKVTRIDGRKVICQDGREVNVDTILSGTNTLLSLLLTLG
jgi:hypothetical protein